MLSLPLTSARKSRLLSRGLAQMWEERVSSPHPPTQAELLIVQHIVSGLREQGFEIVSRDLICRISDYFHVNARPKDDLAIGYMRALDAIILRGFSPPVPPAHHQVTKDTEASQSK
jgi:hypothetical protein